ncbi:hypothetical protein HS088_TW12G00902 [Tripterygium wilfordii]|uniref:Uncharacterized protein n=1 Tax=Tripterygium wilfordii TaxID=458696 RepID=A0A7J7D001_TRIWF|nr:uncharacterized protein LOC120010563 [Tripterygium wilfordii]KAF5739692.1 hypothetical protein HS088_TW12G00902 [Tripterygium wilfordii]
MGNGYNRHQTLHHKTTFLPTLCSRPSIKDVAIIPRWEERSSSSSNDPLSPKIGCMGQIKRNEKFNLGFHTSRKFVVSDKTINNHNNNNSPAKYFKLKKILSGKNYSVNTSTTTATSTINNDRICRRRGGSFDCGSRPRIVDGKENSGFVNIVEMDPPLPVIRKMKPTAGGGGEAAESLWKRRSGGVALQSLRLQEIQIRTWY